MRNHLTMLMGGLLLIFAGGCGKTGVDPVEDATDYEAIYNIIKFDYPSLFSADKLEIPAPDTSEFLGAAPFIMLSYWRTVNWDSLYVRIFDEGEILEDSTRWVRYADVGIEQHFKGTIEIIAADTSNGGNTRIRMSKSYTAKATISGIVKKYGFDYNTRRGWRLTEIGGVFYGSHAGQVKIWAASNPQDTITIGLGTYPLTEFPVFADGESLTVSVAPTDPIGAAAIKCPTADGFLWRQLTKTESGTFVGGFRLYNNIYDKHFIVDMVRSRVFEQDTTRYFALAIGVPYNVRQ